MAQTSTKNYTENYVFWNPFSSSIHPIPSTDQLLVSLHEINVSRPNPETRLPMEILLRIVKEIHLSLTRSIGNPLLERIRDSWTHFSGKVDADFRRPGRWAPPRVDLKEKKFYLSERPPFNSSDFLCLAVSSADLLYRLRCCFPEIEVDSSYDTRPYIWAVAMIHSQSGFLLQISDYRAAVRVLMYEEVDGTLGKADKITKQTILEGFAADVMLLLSILHETVDEGRRLAYYHPAADADFIADDGQLEERGYIAVPYGIRRHRQRRDEPISVYRAWESTGLTAGDISSSQSILHNLKYDILSGKINRSNDAASADLTTVISSALLFYRLIIKFMLFQSHNNVNAVPPVLSVWQIRLTHVSAGCSIIFMDDRGLFDIRADAGVKDVMGDIVALVEALCSDTCTHPYDNVVAGCIP